MFICEIPLYVQILIPAAILGVLAVIFAVLLAYLSKKLAVARDERIDEVNKNLAGANCGGCGFAGCEAFAKAVVEGKADLSMCSATSKEKKDVIAQILGIANDGEEQILIVACRGGNNCENKYDYQGYGDCRSMELLAGGRKACPVGCMGMGSCTTVCPTHAVDIVGSDGFASIDVSRCVKCKQCLKTCPKGLIKLIPATAKVYVACSSHDKGKDVRTYCKNGCIGCGLCSKVCPHGAIEIKNNLAEIDYSKCTGCGLCAEKCPVKCIVKR